jgi:hypothetical protein
MDPPNRTLDQLVDPMSKLPRSALDVIFQRLDPSPVSYGPDPTFDPVASRYNEVATA